MWLIPKITRAKRVVTGQLHKTNKYFVLKLIPFNSGNYKSASGQLQGNFINRAMSITVNRVFIQRNILQKILVIPITFYSLMK